MPLAPHIKAFNHFADSFLNGGEDDELIILKREHSLRVLENATAIVENEPLDRDTARLCLLSALYHDIGRFQQFATYHTFNDRESVNHGRMGVLELRKFDLPGNLTEREQRIIRFAVGQHNLKTVRPSLPSHLEHPLHVVRDADKLDIFNVMMDYFHSDSPNPLITFGMGNGLDGNYTDAVYQAVMLDQDGDYALLRHASDFLLLLLGWLPTLHYGTTLALIRQRGYLDGIFSLLPKDKKMQELKEKTHTFMSYNNSVAP
jgi:putative nucleotidyltransferase with HDIG domain